MVMWLARLLGRPRQSDPAAFEVFLARQSAFVAQKAVLDYCRVKTGRAEEQAFADPDFQAALLHCRWQTYLAALADVAALAEAWLRPSAAGQEAALAAAIARLGEAILDNAPAPPEEAESLAEWRLALGRHLAAVQQAPPLPAHTRPLLAAAPLLATLPIHADQRRGETPSIKGGLRFLIVSTQQEMERAFDGPALAAALVAKPG
jgi:hypothetical protein